MQLLTNFDEQSNHYAVLRRLAAGADELIVLSPYLSRDLAALLSKFVLDELRAFRLVTTLEPLEASQLWTVDGLQSVRDFFRTFSTAVKVTLQVAHRLHGKVYIFKQRGEPFAAVVTSANFTQNGLRLNAEWGFALRDPKVLSELSASVDRLSVRDISDSDLDVLVQSAADYRELYPAAENAGVALDLVKAIDQSAGVPAGSAAWLKPSGVSDNPVLEGESFADVDQDLHFSKVRPSGVRVGDTMIMYGVGARRILSVFEVTGSVAEATAEEIRRTPWKARWPWYVPARNLTPRFGASWWHHNLYVTTLVTDYLASHPNASITSAGGQTLGALNHGADKVRLDRAFADWIVAKVMQIEEALAAASTGTSADAVGV
jgi:hypothetical protein